MNALALALRLYILSSLENRDETALQWLLAEGNRDLDEYLPSHKLTGHESSEADAEWKRIQKNTFSRWCNEYLIDAGMPIRNLDTDLRDGVRLIVLLEALSGEDLGGYYENPVQPFMKIGNVMSALKFLKDQDFKLVKIDATGICDGDQVMTLSLIWTLILRYSIAVPLWADPNEDWSRREIAKEHLFRWIYSKRPELRIADFTTAWNDGRAIGALVSAISVEQSDEDQQGAIYSLCHYWKDWKPEDALENTRKAMKTAEVWLGVPQLMAPEDMVNPHVDELSMMTYLSAFLKAKLKPGAPLGSCTAP